jgi:hypothetical protein
LSTHPAELTESSRQRAWLETETSRDERLVDEAVGRHSGREEGSRYSTCSIWACNRGLDQQLQDALCKDSRLGVQLDCCTNIDHFAAGAPVAVRQCAERQLTAKAESSSIVVGFDLTADVGGLVCDDPNAVGMCHSGPSPASDVHCRAYGE